MATCKTCVFFRTDNDCDGPACEWCTLGYREDSDSIGDRPACSAYSYNTELDEYDWDD